MIATYAWSKAKNIANDFSTRPRDITNADFELDCGYDARTTSATA